ncbi:MAG: hypothetical protein ABIT83_02515 [Massilia sp.]
MSISDMAELEDHLRRIQDIADSWSTAERHARTAKLRLALLEEGIPIDDAIEHAIEKFNQGEIGFEGLSIAMRGKIL